MNMNTKTLARALNAFTFVALASMAASGADYTLFGGATIVTPGNNSSRAVKLESDNAVPFSGIDFTIPSTLTFADIQALSTDYMFTAGSCGGGSPRFQINVGGVNAFVYIGPPPNYTGCAQNVWVNTGNLVAPASFIDTSQLPGGTFYDTFAAAYIKYGSMAVTGIQLVADGGFAFPNSGQTVLIDNTQINGALITYELVADDTFQVRYAANLNVGDSFVDITNTGATVVAGVSQNLCANLYAFDPAEELIACCTCSVTPNGLQSLSVLKSLISNPLTPAIPTAVVVKMVATTGTCNAATASTANLAHGLLAWGTTLHQNSSTSPTGYLLTETAFSLAVLSDAEISHISSTCGFIQSNGSGFGICKGCAAGGLGAPTSIR